ncbi:31994_t:CDS:1, partial [Racocetra persica]
MPTISNNGTNDEIRVISALAISSCFLPSRTPTTINVLTPSDIKNQPKRHFIVCQSERIDNK